MQVDAAKAAQLQEQGEWVLDSEGRRCFSADYLIHYRPDGKLNHTDPDRDVCKATKLR